VDFGFWGGGLLGLFVAMYWFNKVFRVFLHKKWVDNEFLDKKQRTLFFQLPK
jgi:hypothetical protein